MVKERRSRSKSPPRRTAEVTTKGGKKYEVKEQPRAKGKKQVEAAERRREKDAVVQAVASTLQKQPAGRPKKGEEGPRKGSLRYATEATGGLVGRGQLQRGVAQLAEHGKVRCASRPGKRQASGQHSFARAGQHLRRGGPQRRFRAPMDQKLPQRLI